MSSWLRETWTIHTSSLPGSQNSTVPLSAYLLIFLALFQSCWQSIQDVWDIQLHLHAAIEKSSQDIFPSLLWWKLLTAKLFCMLPLCWVPSILNILLFNNFFLLYLCSPPSLPLFFFLFAFLHFFLPSPSTPLHMSPITVYFSVCPVTRSWWAWRLHAAGATPWLRCRCGASWLTPALFPRKAAWCWFAQRKLWVWRKRRRRTLKRNPVFCKYSWFNINVLVFFFSPQLSQGVLGIGLFLLFKMIGTL